MLYAGMNRNDGIQPFLAPGTAALDPHNGKFISQVYRCVDRAANQVLSRLQADDGIVPSCHPGCCACCKQHILATAVEARALTEYIRRQFSAGQLRMLKERTRRWLSWDRLRLQPSAAAFSQWGDEAAGHPACPLLVDGICSVYPMRPMTCRTHFVSTPPSYCRHDNDPQTSGNSPLSLSEVVRAAAPFSAMIRDRIEAGGGDYLKSIMLLPHWLPIEMGWELAPAA